MGQSGTQTLSANTAKPYARHTNEDLSTLKPSFGVYKQGDLRHIEIGTNMHTTITHSNQTPPTRLHTVTIRQKDRKVFIDRLTRLLGYRSDGAVPSRSNRETIDQASGRPMDTVIHRPRRPSQALINWLAFIGALVFWSVIGYLTVQYWIIANG